jgi:gliding motility-associated lipoprotein GldD
LRNSNDFTTFAPILVFMRTRFLFLFVLLLVVSVFAACRHRTFPKQYGYFRIAIPDTAYEYCDLEGYPYTFRLSKNAFIEKLDREGDVYWIDIQYPTLNATIHCSYKVVNGNLRALSKDAQEFLYSHSTVASAIPAQEFANADHHVYGLYFELHGNTATPMQFYLTDSTKHFFRGSVYCNTVPNQDSLAPIYDYLRLDARMIMESMKWR